MTICPKCKAENRPEAAFCSNCGTILLNQPNQVKPTPVEPVSAEVEQETERGQDLSSEVEGELQPKARTTAFVSDAGSGEVEPSIPEPTELETTPPIRRAKPAPLLAFSPRSSDAVFGNRFRCDDISSAGEHDIRYTVKEICTAGSACVRVCSNPDCHTIHIPVGTEQEKFCTHCGTSLDDKPPLLWLQESDSDRFSDLEQVINLHLAHPNVHPPVITFQEEYLGSTRYCLVTPYSQDLPEHPDLSQALAWGQQLASGLDYLHSYNIVFGPEIDLSEFGLVDEKIVWRKFDTSRLLPMLTDREKINDVRLLALSLYSWITGQPDFSPEASLNPRLHRLFEQALMGEGFTSGTELAQGIDRVLKAGLTPFNLDYNVGRRTHPGQVRAINEDSLLCFSMSNMQQGISQPIGIFALADGMGGHATGDLASSLAIQTIALKASSDLSSLQNLPEDEYVSWLKQAVQAANQAVYTSRQRANNDMGSTLVCALLFKDKAYLIHVGDSRIYHLRASSFKQLTTDHSVVQQLVTIGKIRADEARTHPQRNVIYRSLGEKLQVEYDTLVQDLQPGDKLLLCSDGLNGMLDDQKMQILIQESPSPQIACDYLVDAANLAGGEDNISTIVVEVISV